MRQFARPFPIDRLSLEARVLYTAFLVFLLAGVGSSVWLYRDSFGGISAEGARTYYLGNEAGAAAERAPPEEPLGDHDDEGPALDLPDEEPAAAAAAVPEEAGLVLQKSPRQVLETFHFHLFTVPVVLLIVGHLFMLTALSLRVKIGVIALGSLATLAHLFAPLAVRFGGAGWAPAMPITVVAAALGWLPMLVWPLWEMWTRLPQRVPAKEQGA